MLEAEHLTCYSIKQQYMAHVLILCQKGLEINNWSDTVTASNHLVGQQDAGDGLSIRQHGLVVQVLFPMATAKKTGWTGDVKHHNTAQRALIIDPGHGNEALLAWREDTKFTSAPPIIDPSTEKCFVPAMSQSCSLTFSVSDHCSTFTEKSTGETKKIGYISDTEKEKKWSK